MPYNELIKNFNVIRDYIRDFYVYGFDSREDSNRKSKRTYDDARRRVESWLSDYMKYRREADGKRVFISVDTRRTVHDPLFAAFKAKSFTDGDITLFFIIFDILHDSSVSLPLGEIVDAIDRDHLSYFDSSKTFDTSTIRKKLNEFAAFGLIKTEKRGKTLCYSRAESYSLGGRDALHFFSEVAPCGVIGSFLLDRCDETGDILSFKHHYINSTLDSEIVCSLLCAMHSKRETELVQLSRNGQQSSFRVVPLRIFISVSNGRQYLMAYVRRRRRIISFRTDHILSVKACEKADDFDVLREKLAGMQSYMWGVSTQGSGGRRESVEFTVFFGSGEQYIYRRLMREKRCGTVELLDEHHARFSAEVYDANEMITWIRTFICRITSISFSNKAIEDLFKADIKAMSEMYDRLISWLQEEQAKICGDNDKLHIKLGGNCPRSLDRKFDIGQELARAVYPESDRRSVHTAGVRTSSGGANVFSEIYGAYYNAVAHILSEAAEAPISMERIREIAAERAFAESGVAIENAVRTQAWQLILPDGSTPIKHKPDIPMTLLQLRWLKAISLDKRIKLFDCHFDLPEDIDPLFTEDDYYVFDRYSDGDDYEDAGYIERFRTILSAVRGHRALDVTIRSKKGNELSCTVLTEGLEYSEKDDKFRLLTSGSRMADVINLGRVTGCAPHDGEFEPERARKHTGRSRTLTLELVDERNALERVMLHFSHFQKTAERLEENRYRLVITYEQDDETEILIRVLSFGPLVRVTAPDRFIGMIRNRLRSQKRYEL